MNVLPSQQLQCALMLLILSTAALFIASDLWGLPVFCSLLITVEDQAYKYEVCRFNNDFGASCGHTVICVR